MGKIKSKEEMKTYRRYHSPHTSNLNSVKLNAIFINKGYTYEHELMKFNLAWETKCQGSNYITEAERSATEQEVEMFGLKTKKKIIDFVDLTSGQEVEIVNKHESDKQIAHYRKELINVMFACNTIICNKCRLKYPMRGKQLICQVCKSKTNV